MTGSTKPNNYLNRPRDCIAFLALLLTWLLPFHPSNGAEIKVRLGTLAPKGSSYTKHLQLMGEQDNA